MKYYQSNSQKRSSGDAEWHGRDRKLRKLGRAILDHGVRGGKKLSAGEEREIFRLQLIADGLLKPTSKKAVEQENSLYA